MFEKMIAVVDLTAPVEIAPAPAPEPERIESQAHKDWVIKKREFMERHNNGQEPTGAVLTIMTASIGPEPSFE